MANSLQLYIVCAFSAIGGFCFGYDTGVISSVRYKTLYDADQQANV